MSFSAVNYTVDPGFQSYIGKRCYARPLFRDWLWSRKIKAIRFVQGENLTGGRWEVKLRNWFWHEWVALNYCKVVTAIYD